MKAEVTVPKSAEQPARKSRWRMGIHAKIGLILLAFAIYIAQQSHVRISEENIKARRIAQCKQASAPIKLAFVYPDYLKKQFLAGAELAVDLANANVQGNNLRPITWEFFPESEDSVLKVAGHIAENPSYFGVVGFFYSQVAVNAFPIFNRSGLVTIFSSINSSRVMAFDSDYIFSTASTSDEIGKQIIPSLWRILPPGRFTDSKPIRMAIIRSPGIYPDDICLSLYADIAKNNAKLQVLSACKANKESTLRQLLDSEKISYQQYAIVSSELATRPETSGSVATVKASSIIGPLEHGAIQVDTTMDITYTPERTELLGIVSQLASQAPDVIFLAAAPTIAVPLIRQFRKYNPDTPIIASSGLDNIKELEPYRESFSNFYVLTSYDESIQGKALREVAEEAARLNPQKYKNFTPDSIGVEAYQAVSMLIEACRSYPEYYPESIAPVLRYSHPKGWNILGQRFTVNPDQTFDDNLPLNLKKYENGRFVNVRGQKE